MQYINLNKTIELESKIEDLLLISIDDQIETIDDKDGVRISGKITIGGNAKTLEGDKNFSDLIDLDIFLNYEEIVERNSLNISVNDFNYQIEDNKLKLDISLKINGLKEIETTFLTEEDNSFFQKEEVDDENKKEYKDEEIEDNKEIHNDRDISEIKKEIIDEEENNSRIFETQEIETIKEIKKDEERINENIEEFNEDKEIKFEKEIIKNRDEILNIEEKKSLIKSVFSNKRVKEEVSWKLHCVKNEKNYEEIAKKYNVSVEKLISINNNESLSEGKLIFLPLD